MGIDKNTVCRWIRDYRRKHHLPIYAESKGIKQAASRIDKEANKQLLLWGYEATAVAV